MKSSVRKERYDKIDGLRIFAAIGILLMHVMANGKYRLQGFLFERLIPSFTDLVFLFMIISGFSTCCGYFDKIQNGEVSLGQFYSRRIKKILPFFALLSLMELVVSPSVDAVYEVLANLSLCFGLIPNHGIEVVGVGWFLGLTFVFYFLFPFFCYLLSERKRAWFAFVISLLLHFLCTVYFNAERTSIAYSAVFFLAGGMLFLYRNQLQTVAEKYTGVILLGIALVATLYFVLDAAKIIMLLLGCLILIYALGSRNRKFDLLANTVTKKLSGISMEIYLSHMVIFRAVEKLGLTKIVASDLWSYIIAAGLTFIGTMLFAVIINRMFSQINKLKTQIGKKTEDHSER